MKNIIITGTPRSGTSLLTKLLSEQNNTLCFSEPSWLREIRSPNQTPNEFAVALEEKIISLRDEIKKGNPVTITVKRGSHELPDNYFKKTITGQINLKQDKEVFVEHSDSLVIVVKANTLFTACLNEIINQKSSDIYAMQRNPYYTLLSWRSLDIPISKGKLKIGEIYSKDVQAITKEPDILKRQVLILNWFSKQFQNNKCNIIYYEELIREPNKILKKILDDPIEKNFNLSSKNTLQNYSTTGLQDIERYLDKYLDYNY